MLYHIVFSSLCRPRQRGKSHFVYTLEQLLERNMLIQQSMYSALKDRELFIQYQPKYLWIAAVLSVQKP